MAIAEKLKDPTKYWKYVTDKDTLKNKVKTKQKVHCLRSLVPYVAVKMLNIIFRLLKPENTDLIAAF